MASSSTAPSPEADNESLITTRLSQAHYKEWIRMQKKSTRVSVTFAKFLIQFSMYCGETASLVATLVLGVVIPTKETKETIAAIILYLFSALITVAVGWSNKTRTASSKDINNEPTQNSRLSCWWLATVFMVLKPFRYLKMFIVRKRKVAIIGDGSKLNKQGLEAMNVLDAAELEDRRVELHEAFFQSIPMMLLQTYYLFQAHQQFTLCDMADLSRLTHIILAISQAAKCAATYEGAKSEYEASLHFLSFYTSGGTLPLRIYSSDMISLTGLALFVCHFFTIFSRIYTASYFLVISWKLSALFLLTFYLVNLAIIKLFPHVFLEVLENAPFGASTTSSYYSDRYINTFCNVGTRFHKFSEEIKVLSEKNKKFWFRLPLVLVQIIPYGVAIGIVYLTMGYFDGDVEGDHHDHDMITPTTTTTTLSETFSQCPKIAEWYDANDFSRMIGTHLFSVYRSANDRFQTFNDVFNMIHMNWLLFYCQLLYTALLFSYADLRKRRRDPVTVPEDESDYFDDSYPIMTAYSFWGVLIDQVLKGCRNNNNEWERVKVSNRIRKLMLLTVLSKGEFYGVTRYFSLFPRMGLSTTKCLEEAWLLVERLKESESEIDRLIGKCFESGHPFTQRFFKMYEVMGLGEGGALHLKDKKLFFAFFATFDLKMYTMRSDKVGRVFELVGGVKRRCCCWGESGEVVRKYNEIEDDDDNEMY